MVSPSIATDQPKASPVAASAAASLASSAHPARAEDVDRARAVAVAGPDHDGVALDGHRAAELVAVRAVARGQLQPRREGRGRAHAAPSSSPGRRSSTSTRSTDSSQAAPEGK